MVEKELDALEEELQELGQDWDGYAVVGFKAARELMLKAHLEGVRAGLEAAAALCEKHHDRDQDKAVELGAEGCFTEALRLSCRAEGFAFASLRIRVIRPASVSAAGALREKGTKT